jgi:endoglucanase
MDASQNERLGRGVNVFGYDPGWTDPGRRRMQAAHFRQIEEAGFSHVRIPLHPFARMAGDDYRIDENWLAVVDWALEQALANNLLAILDCHEYHPMAQDPEPEAEVARLLATDGPRMRRHPTRCCSSC